MKLKLVFAAICSAAILATAMTDASAAGIRVKCEKRSDRSKISVDGDGLATGSYKAIVISGANSKTSGAKPTVGDEVEFDFDSAPNDIAAGATAISRTFIQGAVTGKIVNARGSVVASDTVACRTR
jgi:hypothetical protein